MNNKRWYKYLIYLLLVLAAVFLNTSQFFPFFNKSNFTFNYFHLVVNILTGVLIGVIMGFEHLYTEYKKEGLWKINLPKLIILGLPSLYFSLTYIVLYNSIPVITKLVVNTSTYLLNFVSDKYISFFQLILGYVLITSFYKAEA